MFPGGYGYDVNVASEPLTRNVAKLTRGSFAKISSLIMAAIELGKVWHRKRLGRKQEHVTAAEQEEKGRRAQRGMQFVIRRGSRSGKVKIKSTAILEA